MLLGFAFTSVLIVAFASFFASLFYAKRELLEFFGKRINIYTIFCLIIILLFFLTFSLLFVHPVEQLYFDENIYQGIAMNILAHGNALWCQYGTGFLAQCSSNAIYHDLIGYPFLIAIAFGAFGISIGTAYALQLLIGLLSIFFIFLLASAIFEKKSGVVAATLTFALIPQLFIWSRTQAIPDLALMAFATLTFSLFVFFTKKPSLPKLSLFMSALVITLYMRIEAVLLLPLFALLFFVYAEGGIIHNVKERIRLVVRELNENTKLLMLSLLFFVLIVPDIYYLSLQFSNPSYGQSFTNQQAFSISNLVNNYQPNLLFFLGDYNSVSQFPLVFPLETTLLAIAGGALLFIFSGRKDRNGLLAMLVLWIMAYMLFYDLFYAGAATFGVDDRFMLQMIPALCILAGFGVSEAAAIIGKIKESKAIPLIASLVLLIVLVVVPFITLIPNITLKPQNMPQQTVIYDALSFFHSNYNRVPTNCLVYTFTPDLWYEVNRSAAQIGSLTSIDPQSTNFSDGYSCKVIDYGYWCNVPPYKSTSCKSYLSSYNLLPLANYTNASKGEHFGFYQIINAT